MPIHLINNYCCWPHNEELHSLYRSPNIVMVIKSRRLRWAGHGMEVNLQERDL